MKGYFKIAIPVVTHRNNLFGHYKLYIFMMSVKLEVNLHIFFYRRSVAILQSLKWPKKFYIIENGPRFG